MKIFFSILFLFFFTFTIEAQIDTSSFRKELDNILEDITGDKDDSQFYDQVEYLIENPIQINSAKEEDLIQIPFLDREDAAAIIEQRKAIGKFTSADQLREIGNLSAGVVDKILPFISFQEEKDISFIDYLSDGIKSVKMDYRSRALRDIQQDNAYQKGKYYGSDLKIYNRLIINNKENFHAALVMEKDPGEKSLNDFTAFHVMAKNLGPVQNLLIGDYNFEFGQGLAIWGRALLSKGTETVGTAIRDSRGIKPYQSTDENMFFRGAAAKFSFSGINVYSFYSNKYYDGSIDPTTNQIKSITVDGYHRDSSEVAHKRIVNEKIYGASADYRFMNHLSIGLLYYRSIYANDFYNNSVFDPTGRTFDYISANYNFVYGKLSLSGEAASDTKHLSSISNLILAVDRNFKIVFSYRNYSSHYWNWHSAGFGEKDGSQNEIGFYTGIHWSTPYGIFRFYYDQFQFPITSDKFMFPSQGNDFLIYYTVKLLRSTELRLKYKIKTKDAVGTINDQLGLVSGTTENYRAEFLYNVAKNLDLHSRLEMVNVHATSLQQKEKGFLIYQDVQYIPVSNLNLRARLILFKTDSYNSRIYEFESDLTGVMSTPPVYGDGMRWYLVVRYKTKIGLDLSMKYSETIMPGERTLGSGDNLINSNVDNRLSFQLDYKL